MRLWRRRSTLDQWSPAKTRARAEWSQRLAEHMNTLGLGVQVVCAAVDIWERQWWAVPIPVGIFAFLAWSRAHLLTAWAHRIDVNAPAIDVKSGVPLDDMPTEVLIAEVLPALTSASALTLTAFVGRALAEGWSVDRIIETSNMPGDMVRHYAEQAERGL